jgi:hypothetical protein
MDQFGLPNTPLADVQTFTANSVTASSNFAVWQKPLGKSMCHIFMLGTGGGGGTGVIGANSVSAGGGGGGSGGQTVIMMPMALLPPRLYISVGMGNTAVGAGIQTTVSVLPNGLSASVVGIANGGTRGGNAAAGTGGIAGAAGTIALNSAMPLGWAFSLLALAGQIGIVGGAAVAGGALALPTTGLRVTGGTGGGGLPAAAGTGTSGGNITASTAPTFFQGNPGGIGSATATNPADPGRHGFLVPEAGFFFYGGTGGASTHGTATGGGLVQSRGGDGAIGCGAGGQGGALTGSAAAGASKGGDGLVIITSF